MNVILPLSPKTPAGTPDSIPVLYLLHGYNDDHSTWLRMTNIERHVADRGIAVIMPSVHKSYYANMHIGDAYWTFVSEELPAVCRAMFRVSEKREDTFVAGLSMGGYGAFKLALNFPDRFAAAASLSGALLPEQLWARNPAGEESKFGPIFGSPDRFRNSINDLSHLVLSLKQSGKQIPRLFQCCGTEDFLYEDNQTFLHTLRQHNIPVTYEEGPGSHQWAYWDTNIARVLDWLPIRPR